MCGIAGFINKDGRDADEADIIQMTDLVAHRGPDGAGHVCYGSVAFGHRRLAILDLTNGGSQPMRRDALGLTITFNGEIYNYIELREELKTLGWQFFTASDTEVILVAYAAWGRECVSRFNGMWAFAIYDRSRHEIFCSRDRFGVKPFYWLDEPSVFAFGSEIKQLVKYLDEVKAEQEIVLDFILTGICDHSDATFFVGVHKLSAGCNLIYNINNSEFRRERYYSIGLRQDLKDCDESEAVRTYGNVLDSAVALRLRSDVPVGTCLSGGLDSSAVAVLASDRYHRDSFNPFCAITAVSEQASNDESIYAHEVATNRGMHWLTVRPSYDDFVDALPAIVYAQEEPFGGPSIVMQYYVMKCAHENGIKVLLDGQGGDETLLGYDKYYAAHLAWIIRHHGWLAVVGAVRDTLRNNTNMSIMRLAMYIVGGLSARLRYMFYSHRHRYLNRIPRRPKHLEEFARYSHDIVQLQMLENTSTNLPVLLRYEDKNSMANSVETRLPFLDYRAFEIALSLPGEFKIRNGWTKWVLRRVMDGLLPSTITWRKNKMGFEAPEDLWLTRHQPQMRAAVLASPLLSVLCDLPILAQKYDSLDKRSRWRLYSVALWERTYGIVV